MSGVLRYRVVGENHGSVRSAVGGVHEAVARAGAEVLGYVVVAGNEGAFQVYAPADAGVIRESLSQTFNGTGARLIEMHAG